METLDFQPDYGMSKKNAPSLHKADFGDGYTQTRPKGLNHNLRTYSLTFSGAQERIDQIDRFLTRHGGYQSFRWKPANGPVGKFRCEEHNVTYNAGYAQLTADFVESII